MNFYETVCRNNGYFASVFFKDLTTEHTESTEKNLCELCGEGFSKGLFPKSFWTRTTRIALTATEKTIKNPLFSVRKASVKSVYKKEDDKNLRNALLAIPLVTRRIISPLAFYVKMKPFHIGY